MILESIVTSVDKQGNVNIAPMGPVVDPNYCDDTWTGSMLLRPFNCSRTFQNLIATRKAVVHVTDDVDLFAKTAVDALDQGEAQARVRQWKDTAWWPLRDCHRWFAVDVDSVSNDEPRVEMHCSVVSSKIVRPFFGFNRAKFAVIEAAILATRTHLLPLDEIEHAMASLQPLIDKTGGQAEHAAFEFLRKTIHERFASR